VFTQPMELQRMEIRPSFSAGDNHSESVAY